MVDKGRSSHKKAAGSDPAVARGLQPAADHPQARFLALAHTNIRPWTPSCRGAYESRSHKYQSMCFTSLWQQREALQTEPVPATGRGLYGFRVREKR